MQFRHSSTLLIPHPINFNMSKMSCFTCPSAKPFKKKTTIKKAHGRYCRWTEVKRARKRMKAHQDVARWAIGAETSKVTRHRRRRAAPLQGSSFLFTPSSSIISRAGLWGVEIVPHAVALHFSRFSCVSHIFSRFFSQWLEKLLVGWWEKGRGQN